MAGGCECPTKAPGIYCKNIRGWKPKFLDNKYYGPWMGDYHHLRQSNFPYQRSCARGRQWTSSIRSPTMPEWLGSSAGTTLAWRWRRLIFWVNGKILWPSKLKIMYLKLKKKYNPKGGCTVTHHVAVLSPARLDYPTTLGGGGRDQEGAAQEDGHPLPTQSSA